MIDLYTIGGIKHDTFITLEDVHKYCERRDRACYLSIREGAKLTITESHKMIAGSAPNVAIGLKRLGIATGVIAVMGNDMVADAAIAKLAEEKVDTKYVKRLKAGENTFSIILRYQSDGAMMTQHAEHQYRLTRCPRTEWLHLSEMGNGYMKLYDDVVARNRDKGVRISFNPGALQIEAGARKLRRVLKATEVLFVNTKEGHDLLREKNHVDIKHLVSLLWKLGPKVVVVTDGTEGAYAFDGGDIWFAPAFPAKRVEATGAGDAFATGFLAAYMSNKDLATALAWGSVNAGSVIGFVGAIDGLLKRTPLTKMLREKKGYAARKI